MSLTSFYRKRITVARVYGIPVRIDYRWFVVFALSAWLISTNFERGGIWIGNLERGVEVVARPFRFSLWP